MVSILPGGRARAWLMFCALAALTCFQTVRAAGATFTIDQDGDVDLFLQAIGQAEARINIAGNVTLDLTGRQDLYIARGVQIIGDRSVYPTGPRIVSNSPRTGEPASYLFLVGDEWKGVSSGVRISGIRLDGGAGTEESNKVGISVRGSRNVEIDHSEFYGWGRAAIEVVDTHRDIDSKDNRAAATSIRVRDNYIHDNRAPKGYGVSLGRAYALIERNVFANNRISIAGDGTAHTGYLVYRNLELDSTGNSRSEPRVTMRTSIHCDPLTDYECGTAGEYLDIRNNSFQNTGSPSFKMPGYPSIQAYEMYNVFALSRTEALETSASSYERIWGNLFGLNTYDEAKYCDFDGDGVVDRFMATGASWWYRSSLSNYRWTYLNQSAKRAATLTLGDVTGDGLCDVSSSGVVYKSGIGATRGTDVLWRRQDGSSPLIWQLATDGNVYGTRDPGAGLLSGDRVLATGDFDGDGDSDVLVRQFNVSTSRILLDDGVATRDPSVNMNQPFAGVGDFDGDGADDVVWARDDGWPEIWFSAMQKRGVTVNGVISPPLANGFQIKGVGDFNGDGMADILINDRAGGPTIWQMRGRTLQNVLPTSRPPGDYAWTTQGVADFDGDRRADILYRSGFGQLAIVFANGTTAYPTYGNYPNQLVESFWEIIGVSDYTGDGRADIFWHNINTGWISIWAMNGATWLSSVQPGHDVGGTWKVEGLLPLRFRADAMPPGSNAVRVPDLTGLTRAQAIQALSAVGLVQGSVGERVDCENLNRVSDQLPGPIKVAPGTSVRLWFGVRPTPPAQCQ